MHGLRAAAWRKCSRIRCSLLFPGELSHSGALSRRAVDNSTSRNTCSLKYLRATLVIESVARNEPKDRGEKERGEGEAGSKTGKGKERNGTEPNARRARTVAHVAREHNAFQVAAMIMSEPVNWLVSTFAKYRTGSHGRKCYLCTPNFNQTELAPLVARHPVNERSIGRSFP